MGVADEQMTLCGATIPLAACLSSAPALQWRKETGGAPLHHPSPGAAGLPINNLPGTLRSELDLWPDLENGCGLARAPLVPDRDARRQ